MSILTNQYLIAGAFVFAFSLLALGYYIGTSERKSRKPAIDVHSGKDDLETRARRAF
jgi:hypothetical protein